MFKLKKKKSQIKTHHASNENSSQGRKIFNSQDAVFTATSDNQNFPNDIWTCDGGECAHYCNSNEGLFDIKEICEDMTVENGRTMTETKV